MFRSPLILGGDLTQLNSFEKELITNTTLLYIDQNAKNCKQLVGNENTVIYLTEDAKSNKKYMSFFNLSDSTNTVHYSLKDLGLTTTPKIKEVWSGQSVNTSNNEISEQVNAHGVLLFEITE